MCYVLNNPVRYIDPLGASPLGRSDPYDVIAPRVRQGGRPGGLPPEPGVLGEFEPKGGPRAYLRCR